MDFIESFIAFAAGVGCAPAASETFIADDMRHYFTIEGDKPGTKKGAYQLRIDDNFAVGWVINYRFGETHTYTSKSDRKWTAEEKAAWKARIDTRKREQLEAMKKLRSEASAKAKGIWDTAKRSGNHPYLSRKQAGLNGARITDGKLVVPIYIDGKMTSLQTIGPDGDKMFLYGGEITGGYFPIAQKDEEKSILVIAEGFATADSIRKSTKLPVIVAFNAGNLKPVAKAIRAKYPASQIVIAADNDSAKKVNVGLQKAQESALAIGGAVVVYPEMEGGSDWNDFYVAKGEKATKEAIEKVLYAQIPQHAPLEAYDSDESVWNDEMPPLEAYSDEDRKTVELYVAGEKEDKSNWKERLYYKDDKLVPRSTWNAQLFMEHDKVLGNLFCYDEFSHHKVVYRCPPWEDVKKFRPRPINDDDITHLSVQLERKGIIQSFGNAHRLLSSVIRKNGRNPAQEYFNSLKWDGVKRLDNWLITYCGARYDDEEYVQAIGRKWLTAAVNRIFEPGTKFDHMLILEGEQNSGKSSVLRELATFHGQEYFNDGIKIAQLGEPDKIIMKLQGVVIIELAELSSFARMTDEEKKAVISTQVDIATLKYQNEAGQYPRKFVLAGTTNNASQGYLSDATGNRRFWPVRTSDKIDLAALRLDKEQLWAEAYLSYRDGEELFLKDELYEKAKRAQAERMTQHPWQPDIEQITHDKDTVFMTEIWDKLKIPVDRRNKAFSREIGGIMIELGFEKTKRRFDGSPVPAWARKHSERELDFD